jgi:organic hydroperoxide reductase OsmC/OhrA
MVNAARNAGKKLPEGAEVYADVSFADREDNVGFTAIPVLTAYVPGWSRAEVEANMTAAHDICPYSNLIRFTHEVELKVSEQALAA